MARIQAAPRERVGALGVRGLRVVCDAFMRKLLSVGAKAALGNARFPVQERERRFEI
jgi:hypothetical protein